MNIRTLLWTTLLLCLGMAAMAQENGKDGKGKKSLSVPPKEKLDAVLGYIREHPGCRSTELMSHTSYSQTTMDRCLFELKKRGLVEYAGSKKRGGYHLIANNQEK